MAIQTRRGSYDDFDPAKMMPGELATVTSGDPGADDGRSVYACFAAGDVKRMATYEDMQENISQATQDVQEDFTAQLTQKISQADTAISQAQTATSAANIAAQGANEAKQEALEAAEAAESYVLGDISNKTVVFSEASTRENINTGESTSTLFGKIKKWFSDLGAAAFHAVANNLTTNTEGSVLDARQGKVLGDAINRLNTKRTWEKLAEQVTLGVWENHSVNNLSQYKEIAVVVHDTQGSFSAYILATSLFTGTTDQVPFGGRPPQGDGFGLGRYINNTTIALFSRVGTQKTELYGIL